MNHSVKSPANSTDTSRLGRSDLQEKAAKSNSRLKWAQIKQAVTSWCTWQCCHQLPHEQISTHTLCYTISQVHPYPTIGFIFLSHFRSNMTEVNAVTITSVHACDFWIWLLTSLHRWNCLQKDSGVLFRNAPRPQWSSLRCINDMSSYCKLIFLNESLDSLKCWIPSSQDKFLVSTASELLFKAHV